MKNPKRTKKIVPDSDLWDAYIESVEPLLLEERQFASFSTSDTPSKRPSHKKVRIVLESPSSDVLPENSPSPEIERRERRRLQSGRKPIDVTLDLHGLTREEAFSLLETRLPQFQASGQRTVLLITGKGKIGGGVLRREVPLWLKEGALAPYVSKISMAGPKHGREGAFYVLLKRVKGYS